MSKLMNLIFKNRTIIWDILKWNREQTNWNGGSIIYIHSSFFVPFIKPIK